MAEAEQIRLVRLLIADVGCNQTLTDGDVDGYLTIEGGNLRRAAAAALDAIATSEVLVSKVIRTQDLQTDGAKVAAALHTQAESLRAQAVEEEDASVFDVFPTLSPLASFELTEYPVGWS